VYGSDAGGGRGFLSTGVNFNVRPRPDSDGKYGRVEAVNMLTREVLWTERHRAPVSSGALDTAGGVIFNGSTDRFFRAYDDQTGKVLWETRLTDVPSDAPISYTANGKQNVAIGIGNGGAQATGFAPLVPEIQNVDRAPAVWFREKRNAHIPVPCIRGLTRITKILRIRRTIPAWPFACESKCDRRSE
jgi:hypothetical protein